MQVPSRWYNIIPDLPLPLPPPVDPPDREGSSIELLNQILPAEVVRQQFSVERWIDIPEKIKESYENFGRPTPLLRARRLEERIGTKSKIFFKYEGALPTGSHKLNAAIPQAYYAKKEGIEGVITETGAGQWGAAVSLAAGAAGIKSTVFMVRSSYDQKQQRRSLMEMYGARVIPSPSTETAFGRSVPEGSSGSLGIAMSEAIEYALKTGAKYLVGSVLEVVLMYQSIIGLEAIGQFNEIGEEPETLIGCVGGGSNFAGFTYPFIGSGAAERFIAVGPAEVPKFSSGTYRYDFPDTAGILPLIKMITLGADFEPPPIYSGGLRYHGVAPTLSMLIKHGKVSPKEYGEEKSAEAAKLFAETQGIVPALESSHAVAAAIDEAKASDMTGTSSVIAFNMSGHGLLELDNYMKIYGDK
ncbi:MAG: TrpB-like pyridoxal phosphate-dependent enzyme [Nitrososphaerota archaeon]|jgi:tryptophan synthase beta chain|nr:TrpB-like pyridoxal phosphate-dependent enzyme [Nitrososphaerota archaeon]MDG6927350.1 TrpB-like pyridoxal phosphate-dependent enzyme [Nitrososphaerota archaeon]MDG6930922.1 TrpB-like pyridoxal phosphate-dependent enzyme [Nitrososphaerota archaeon]MDG6932222.1 TrpB-like pyridoxal phosphate-dependent enzyme [Nitrososphaerota archaeon]MDG6935785.1 TrpB-like pyridoxal phosphate-dependent enzyme [Nitrososphaerota archaeon]